MRRIQHGCMRCGLYVQPMCLCLGIVAGLASGNGKRHLYLAIFPLRRLPHHNTYATAPVNPIYRLCMPGSSVVINTIRNPQSIDPSDDPQRCPAPRNSPKPSYSTTHSSPAAVSASRQTEACACQSLA